jgi:hypothetical protein
VVEWVVLEQVDDAGAQLVALRLADGERRVLYATEQQSPLRASVHPEALRVAVDVQSRGKVRGRPRTRIGLVNLERRGVGWLKQSLDPKWRIARAVFDDTGKRLVLEGAYDGVPISDIYVLELTLSGNSVRDQLLAGAGNPAKLGCARPIFVDGGKQVLYLRNTRPEGAWELSMIELERPGDSATLLEGRAPSVLALTLTDGADAVPDVPLVYCGAITQVFWAGFTRGGSRQQLRTARLGVRPHTDLGRSHQRIEEVAVSSGGELVACSADARVWLTDTETGATVPLLDGVLGASHRGLVFDEVAKRLIFCTSDSDGARMRAVDLVTRSVTTLCGLGDVTVLGLTALAPTAEISARIEAYESVVDELAVAPDATTIQRIRPSSDEPLAASIEALGESSDAETAAPTDAQNIIDEDGDDTASRASTESAVIAPVDAGGDDAAAFAVDDGEDDVQASSPDPTTVEPKPVDAGDTMVIDAVGFDVADADAHRPSAAPAPLVEPEAPQADAQAQGPGDAVDISSSFSIESSPADALASWLKQVAELPDPTDSLQSFEDAREDTQIREAARMFLGTQRRRAAGVREPPVPFLMSIIVAGHLHLHESRSDLQAICKRGRDRVANGDLLDADEHFALSALLYTDGHTSRFGWSTVHQDYTNMFERIGDVLEGEGEGPAGRMMAAFCEGYGRQLDGVLQVTPEDVVLGFDPAQYRAQSLADMAAQATEEAILQREAEAEADRARVLAERAAVEAQVQAERDAIDALAARKRAEFEAQEQARVQNEAQMAREAEAQAALEAARQAEALATQRRAEEEAQAYEQARSAAEARVAEAQRVADDSLRAAEAQAAADLEEERIWAERRVAAEAAEAQSRAADQQAAADAAERAAAAAMAKVEAAEQARFEAEVALEAAEAAARLRIPDAQPARAPLVSSPPRQSEAFNPLSAPGSRDQAAGRPSGSFEATPAQAAQSGLPDFDGRGQPATWSAEESIDMPAVLGPNGLPPIMSIAGLYGAASGIALLVLGLKLGGVFPILGIAWAISGFALFSDKIWGWAAALGVFALNGLSLVMTGLGTEPAWFAGGGPVVWGIATLGVVAALLHPAIRGRYGPKRRKF